MNAFNTIKRRNSSHIYALGARKDFIKKAAAYHVGRKDFNPRPAKYRSIRGLAFDKKESITYLAIQLVPIILLIAVLVYKFII